MPNTQPTHSDIEILQTASQFAYQIWQRKQEACQSFLRSYPLNSTLTHQQIEDLVQDYTLDEDFQLADEQGVMKGLRQLRNLLMMRWIWQDALGVIEVEQLTTELSEFADACIIFAKNYTYQRLLTRYGEPTYKNARGKLQPCDMAIFAMGKLGAKELNLSSDIDLIFIYQGQGETNTDNYPKAKSVDNQRFMTRLGQGVIKLLDSNTADGFVFRVDMRLRPWGDGSDLAMHQSALHKYFSKHGRAWERFAWLKARVINPISDDFDNSLQDIVKPFVFRHYVDYSAFSALREMKSLIENQIAQREDLTNVKLGAGGIRDIEFIVQAYQLIYGGRHSQLQVKPCLQAMEVLYELNHFEKQTFENLQSAYRFLRRLEHGIQAINDQQTQRLPTDEQWQNNLAKTLRFDNWQALLDELDRHRQNVNTPFNRLVTDRNTSRRKANQIKINQQQLDSILDTENQQKLANFWQSKLVANLTEESRKRLDLAFPVLMESLLIYEQHCQKNPNYGNGANVVLPRLLNLLESICRRSIYLVMLAENPDSTINLIPMLSASPWIANELARYPVLLDTFLQQKYRHLPDKAELSNIMRQRLLRVEPSDEEELISVLRLFKKNQVLATAASDIIAERPIMKVSDSLTFIAEVVLEATLQRAFVEIVRRYGYPLNKKGEPVTEADCGFAIVGYGKLGGIELSYSSDLDLVFLHNIKETAMTTGEKPISGMKFAQRLAQKLMTYLTSQTRDGRAYEIDMRLRPSGNAGMMVVSDDAYEQYQLNQAWAWEHQALVRARAICGDKRVMRRFEQIRHKVLSLPREIANVQTEVLAMRQKMMEHLGSDNKTQQQGKFNLKQDAGGIVDIEFLAQFGVLAYAHQYPNLTKYSDNVRIFELLAEDQVWPEQTCSELTQAYLAIRSKTHQLALAEESLLVDEPEWHELREIVSNYWQQLIL